jgi:pantetheine-phosphate adenylyltransferase
VVLAKGGFVKRSQAIYPGYFDPFTLGHLNIVERACRVFDDVVVAVALDSPKQAMFSGPERVKMIREIFRNRPGVEVDSFSGLLAHYIRRRKAKVLLRGIRTVSDFEYEYQMALANKTLDETVETLFMMTEGAYSYLSSTLIKEIARLGGDVTRMVPPTVIRYVRKKYENQSSR